MEHESCCEGQWPDGLTLHLDALDDATCSNLESFMDDLIAGARAGDEALRASYVAKPVQWEDTGQGRETVHFGALVKFNKVLLAAKAVAPMPHELEGVLDRCGLPLKGALCLCLPPLMRHACCVQAVRCRALCSRRAARHVLCQRLWHRFVDSAARR